VILVVGALTAAAALYYRDDNYFYVDLDGNEGTAQHCKVIQEGLVCERDHGAVMVKQYYKN